MMDAGVLDQLATFQPPVQQRDADGGLIQGWGKGFGAWVGVRYLRGGEVVMQARLASRTPAILTFRSSAQARQVTSEWRAVIGGREFALREDPRPAGGGLLEVLAEAGGAGGT